VFLDKDFLILLLFAFSREFSKFVSGSIVDIGEYLMYNRFIVEVGF